MQSQITRTLAAAGDYAAGDILSDSASNGVGTAITFDNVTDIEGGEVIITHATLTGSVDALVPRLSLDIFTANPSSSELDDNAAASVAAADREKYVGTIEFPPLTDRGAISAAEVACYLPAKCVAKALYGILRTVDAFTNESASMTVTILLATERSR